MKKCVIMMLLCLAFIVVPTQKSHAIWWWVAKAAIKKAILAADLAIQRQQNKVIWLQNAQKTIENAMAKLKLEEISSWSEKQRNLYKGYFEELSKVKRIITYYQRVRDITKKQLYLVEEYKRAWSLISKDKNFRADEIRHMGNVYAGILEETVKSIDQLYMVIHSFTTSMSDGKRLEIINETSDRVDQNYADLKQFNNDNFLLSLSHAKGRIEIEQTKQLYGIK